MSAISASKFSFANFLVSMNYSTPSKFPSIPTSASPFVNTLSCPCQFFQFQFRRKTLIPVSSKSSEAEEISPPEDEWLRRLPEKNKALYSHSLPCIEAWLRDLGFYQSKDDRAVWFVQKPEWHAQLSLDVTDLYIRYLKSGSGSLEKDMERRFSYALSREDIENAILGGP